MTGRRTLVLGEATLRAYLDTGSAKGAARRLGVTTSTIRQRLSAYYGELGVENAAQAAYRLDRAIGWLPPS